jgi:hypothetical protein
MGADQRRSGVYRCRAEPVKRSWARKLAGKGRLLWIGRPIFNDQSGNSREVHKVPRYQYCIIGQRNCCDLQVHRANANFETAQSTIFRDRCSVVTENRPTLEIIQQVVQSRITVELAIIGFGLGNVSEPTPHLLFKTDNRHDDVFLCNRSQSLDQLIKLAAVSLLQESKDISVKNDHSPSSSSSCGRSDWRYSRPRRTISSKTGSLANRPAVRIHQGLDASAAGRACRFLTAFSKARRRSSSSAMVIDEFQDIVAIEFNTTSFYQSSSVSRCEMTASYPFNQTIRESAHRCGGVG